MAIRSWTFRLVDALEDQVWLEFDGLTGLDEGLQEFLQAWSQASIRPNGNCLRVYAQGRDFASLAYWGATAPTLGVPFGTYLLLRVDDDHPYLGDQGPAWVLVRPVPEPGGAPKLIGRVEDEKMTDSETVQEGFVVGP